MMKKKAKRGSADLDLKDADPQPVWIGVDDSESRNSILYSDRQKVAQYWLDLDRNF
jgi:hypothetical protein